MNLTESAPVDRDNPSFASLLSALQAVWQGEESPDLLQLYHRALGRQLEQSRAAVRGRDQSIPEIAEQVRIAEAALDLGAAALEALPAYLADPGNRTAMAECVQRYLACRQGFDQAHAYLDDFLT